MKTKVLLTAVAAVIVMITLSVAADVPNKGPEKLMITVKAKGDVKLPHRQHQEVLKECKVCHDVFPKKAGGINELKADGKLQKKQVMNTLCIKCHNEKKNAGVKSGPLTCTACHG